jgi:hypothetical protein
MKRHRQHWAQDTERKVNRWAHGPGNIGPKTQNEK